MSASYGPWTRRLVCLECHHRWESGRVVCPHCGREKHYGHPWEVGRWKWLGPWWFPWIHREWVPKYPLPENGQT